MEPRKRLLLAAWTVWLPLAALAQSGTTGNPFADRLIADLRAQGYAEVEVRRSWLGRVIIEAEAPGREREIVMNPHTGEILRDIWEHEDDDLIGGGRLGDDDAGDGLGEEGGDD